MVELLNTLYVQTQGAVLSLQSDTVRVTLQREMVARMPLLRLSGIVVFGNVTVTPFLVHRCAQDGRLLAWYTRGGRFRARVEGPTSGNVLLRRAQHQALDDPVRTMHVARQVVAAKIQNSRNLLGRSAREAETSEDEGALRVVMDRLARLVEKLPTIDDLNELRGAEGEAGRAYFGVFDNMLRTDREHFGMRGRNRRPPRDPMNSLLSFLYALLRGECESALEGVGLDPQVGYLHALRPGRPALALDLMEELRPVFADRLAFTLINRRQLQPLHFEGDKAIRLTDAGRRIVLVAYQKRKEGQVQHRLLKKKVPLGLVPHLQARLLARYLRGDLEVYPPYVHR
ncbi:MAG: type I-C CRISPR-associated endonuclease Cas1 [Anaerolineales bacterium]|nr:type I-C CRISPR-associated endonuclease Cas1 [Anaerolineales bacterium]